MPAKAAPFFQIVLFYIIVSGFSEHHRVSSALYCSLLIPSQMRFLQCHAACEKNPIYCRFQAQLIFHQGGLKNLISVLSDDEEKIKMKLCENLIRLCCEKNLSLSALSRLSGVSVQTLHNWSVGKPATNFLHVRSVAIALQVPFYELLFSEPDPYLAMSGEALKDLLSGEVQVTVLHATRNAVTVRVARESGTGIGDTPPSAVSLSRLGSNKSTRG